jgi:hypothetical protein
VKNELIEELRSALARRDVKRQTRNEISGQIAELKLDLKEVQVELAKLDTTVEEIQHELVTGKTGLDLVDAAKRNGHATDDNDPRVAAAVDRMKDDERAKRRERDAKRKERERADLRTTSTATKPPSWVDGKPELDETEPWPRQVVEKPSTYLSMHEAIETTPADDAGPPSLATDDIDEELYHALVSRKDDWLDVITAGATNAEILSFLEGIWPRHGKTFVPREQSGGKTGYTITFAGGYPYFWVGTFKGFGHKATYSGTELVAAVRRVLEIPTPSAAAKIAKAPASARETGVSPPSGLTRIEKPSEGWNVDTLLEAAKAMGINANEMIVCGKCGMARPRPHEGEIPSGGGKCRCKSILWHAAYDEIRNRSAEAAEFRRATADPVVADAKLGSRPAFVERPVDNWNGTALANAADDLGAHVTTLVECRDCGAVRRPYERTDCPGCGGTDDGLAVEMPHIGKPKASRKKAKAGG